MFARNFKRRPSPTQNNNQESNYSASLDDYDDQRQLSAELDMLHSYSHLMDPDTLADSLSDEPKQDRTNKRSMKKQIAEETRKRIELIAAEPAQ